MNAVGYRMATEEVNLESTIGGFTAAGQLHTLSVWSSSRSG